MKFLGIDYGAKRLGIAISDDGGTIAFPLITLEQSADLLGSVKKIIEEKRVGEVVIGDTRAVSGEANPITREAQEFSKALASEVDVPVRKVWEAWSSIEASRYAPKGKEHDDAAAAAIILQRYLDTHPS